MQNCQRTLHQCACALLQRNSSSDGGCVRTIALRRASRSYSADAQCRLACSERTLGKCTQATVPAGHAHTCGRAIEFCEVECIAAPSCVQSHPTLKSLAAHTPSLQVFWHCLPRLQPAEFRTSRQNLAASTPMGTPY